MNERGVDEIIDELNEGNPNIDLTKSYLTVDELEKGERLVFAMNRLALLLERARIGDYVSMMGNTWGMMIKNFLAGIARGMGYGIGFLVLGGLGLYLLHKISGWGIPVIGDFVNDILNYIEKIR